MDSSKPADKLSKARFKCLLVLSRECALRWWAGTVGASGTGPDLSILKKGSQVGSHYLCLPIRMSEQSRSLWSVLGLKVHLGGRGDNTDLGTGFHTLRSRQSLLMLRASTCILH